MVMVIAVAVHGGDGHLCVAVVVLGVGGILVYSCITLSN